jgi:hypothetical protein
MLLPRDRRPAGRQSLVRVRAELRAACWPHRIPSASKEGNDRSRAALGPRTTAGRTSRLGRFPLSPDHPHNEHPRPGYRTAQPSDSPPRASRYALRVVPAAPRGGLSRSRPRPTPTRPSPSVSIGAFPIQRTLPTGRSGGRV